MADQGKLFSEKKKINWGRKEMIGSCKRPNSNINTCPMYFGEGENAERCFCFFFLPTSKKLQKITSLKQYPIYFSSPNLLISIFLENFKILFKHSWTIEKTKDN